MLKVFPMFKDYEEDFTEAFNDFTSKVNVSDTYYTSQHIYITAKMLHNRKVTINSIKNALEVISIWERTPKNIYGAIVRADKEARSVVDDFRNPELNPPPSPHEKLLIRLGNSYFEALSSLLKKAWVFRKGNFQDDVEELNRGFYKVCEKGGKEARNLNELILYCNDVAAKEAVPF